MSIATSFDHPQPRSHEQRRAARGATLTLALLACGAAAHAQRSEIYYQLSNANPLTVLTNASGVQTASGPSVGWVYDGTVPQGHSTGRTGTMSISAQSSIGSAKVMATGSGAGYSGFVQGSWDDDVTFSGGPVGTRGTVSFQMGWDWTPSLSVNASGSAHTQPYIDLFMKHVGPRDYTGDQYGQVYEDFVRSCSASLQCTDTTSGVGAHAETGRLSGAIYPLPVVTWAGQLATFRFTVEFGRTYNLMAAIGTFVDGENSVTTLDATHSLTWRGISSVVDAQGQAIAYSVASASGFNYVSAVPEPAAWALMGSGLFGLAALARRQDRTTGA